MGARTRHSGGRGGVLSPRVPTASGMALQCPGWCRYGGDGCLRPMAMDGTRNTGPTSRRGLGWTWNSRLSPLRGLRRPPSRVLHISRTRVGGTRSRR
jgi:hypothetical protein